jgi:hypothetical protein
MKISLTETSLVLQLSRVAPIVVLVLTMVSSTARAQTPDVGSSVQPSSRVRLTGILEPRPSHAVALPWITVWIDGMPWLFHVCQIEPVIPAYRAEEELRKVSGLGLRLLADQHELAVLRNPAMHERPITIEGQLRVRAGVLRVDATYTTELVAGQCSTNLPVR